MYCTVYCSRLLLLESRASIICFCTCIAGTLSPHSSSTKSGCRASSSFGTCTVTILPSTSTWASTCVPSMLMCAPSCIPGPCNSCPGDVGEVTDLPACSRSMLLADLLCLDIGTAGGLTGDCALLLPDCCGGEAGEKALGLSKLGEESVCVKS